MIDYEKIISPVVSALPPSGIRKFFDIVAEMDDAISLGVGEPDFTTPWAIREAGIYSLEKGQTHYTANAGLMELREEICNYYDRKFDIKYNPKKEVLVTVGGSEAIDLMVRTLINPGDEVLIPEPCFVCYRPCTVMAGGVPVPIETKEEDNFRLLPEQLKEKITDKTKLLILPYPNNPTGTVMDRESLMKIAEFAVKHDLIVISDEIYCDLTYEGEHVCAASLPGMKERTIVLNGFSKSYAMTGLRIGYLCAPKEAVESIFKVHQYEILCASATSQYGAIAALEQCDEDVKAMCEEYAARRVMVYEGLRGMGLPVFEPKGAFYAFPDITCTGMDDEEFSEALIREEKVGVVPGSCFGEQGRGHVRISYAASREDLKEALERIGRFVARHKKK